MLESRNCCLSLPPTVATTPFGGTTPVCKAGRRMYTPVDLPDAFFRGQIRRSSLLVIHRNVTPRALRDEILRTVEERGLYE